MQKKNVEDLNVKGRKVLVRCDFNVPIKDGAITNDKRIQAALPTINKLIEGGGKVILCSHLGKPKNGPEDKFSLAVVGARLSELLGKNVVFAKDDAVIGENAKAAINAMNDGDVILLENTRFRAEETKNGEAFSKELAEICDDYVNDAFGSAHRAHCSTAGVTDFVKGQTAVGYLMEKEIEFLGNAVENPERPFVAILGGAKVADKLNVIANLLDKCDTLIIGGGMAYTFMKALGGNIGNSMVDDEKLAYCKEMMAKASDLGKALLIPIDNVVAKEFPNPIDAPIEIETIFSNEIPAGYMGLDIGEETRALYKKALSTAKTIVWNGPMGVFENPQLAAGTLEIAKAVADAGTESGAVTIIGGGDSVAAVVQLGFADKMSHISTGGGASLEYLEGKVLPGIKVIQDK
ncbi:MAG: phosphoglycerate kinase [Oscillospiraceae bacterium]|nr:phosphoglycerate kinase [Oscillospiraceae bacterium]